MGDKIQTAVLFTANFIEEKNVMILIPQKIVVGECNEDTSYFYSYLDNKEYQNADDAVREENYIGFYDIKTIGELKEYYNIKDLGNLLNCYFDDLYKKVYYYDLSDEENFESYFMKRSSIEEFNEKYDLKFSYQSSSQNDSKPKEKEEDPLTRNFSQIKKVLDKNILFQNDAKDRLLTTLYNNALTGESKSHIIISGPSGVGKSEMLKLIATHSTQPVLYTKFAPNFVDDAEEYLDSLLLNCYYLGLSKEDPIIFRTIIIDDFDKNFNYSTAIEVIDEITRFMNDKKRFVRYSSESKNGVILNSDNITFIICGNFDKVKREKLIPNDFFKDSNFKFNDIPISLNKDELISNFGFYEETLESFNTHIDFNPLNLEKTKRIITHSDNSLFKSYCKQLKEQGINLNVSDEAIELISKKIYSKNKNIKNINEVITNIFKDIINASFTMSEGTEILVDEQIIDDHSKYQLKKCL